MAKYKKDKRVVKQPGSPGIDYRDVDWEEKDPSAISVQDYYNHMQKKAKLMTRNMKTLKKVAKKDMRPEEAEYLAKQEWEYKKRMASCMAFAKYSMYGSYNSFKRRHS